MRLNKIYDYYEDNFDIPSFLFFTACVIVLHLLYRIEVYFQFRAIYHEMDFFTLCDFFVCALHHDAVAILIITACLNGIFFLPWSSMKVKDSVSMVLVLLIAFFMVLCIEFFRVYETAFQKTYIGREHITGIGDMIGSAVAEISVKGVVEFIILTVFIITCARKVRRHRMKKIPAYAFPDPYRMMMIIPALYLVLILCILTTHPLKRLKEITSPLKDAHVKKIHSTLAEIISNPLVNLFAPARGLQAFTRTTDEKFLSGFDTASFEKTKKRVRLTAIPRGKKYSIIFYFFESFPAKYLGHTVNGKSATPNWLRLSKNSINMRNHYVNYPLSANALLSILASAYDLHSKDLAIQKYPRIKLSTLPEILSDAGYRTFLIHPGDLGYAGQADFLKNRKFDRIVDYNDLKKIPPYNFLVGWGVDERAMIEPSIRFAKERPGEPFFMIYMPVNPHHPYAIPEKKYQISGEIPSGTDRKTQNWMNYLNSLYYSDAVLGALVDRLEKEQLLDTTLLFVFSDHGEAFYQHRMNYNHPLFLYEENVHVPFLIYNKKLFPLPLNFDGITRHIDILPTVLDILQIPGSSDHEGVSLLEANNEQLALIHTSWKDDYMAVRDGAWKYIIKTGDGTEELYNLGSDPDEAENIAPGNPDITKKYRNYVQKAIRYKTGYYRKVLSY